MINLNPLLSDNNLQSSLQQIKDVPNPHDAIVGNVVRKCVNNAPKQTTAFSDLTRFSHPDVASSQSEILKISGAVKDCRYTPEAKQRISEALKGNRHTLETRKKISEAVKYRWRNPETRQKMSEAMKGRRCTPETRQRISEVKKRVLAMPEARQKMSEAAKRAWGNPEVREKY